MVFAKVVKNKAYYSRFQVKYRRRRQAKTDYYARKRLVWMDKNKYAAPKHRLVVRFSNRDVVTQIVASDVNGDRVLAAAYGHELSKYGLKFGFNNWPATYCTGLLLAKKLNVNPKMRLPFLGAKEVPAAYHNVGDVESEGADASGVSAEERRPFKAVLDVGLHCTTTGARIFAAVKGACDGGLNVPHSTRRFPGTPTEKGAETDFEIVTKYVFGGHIADHMRAIQEEDEDAYKARFSQAVAAGVGPDDLEELYKGIHAKIRAETAATIAKKEDKKLGYFGIGKRTSPKPTSFPKKAFNAKRLTVTERKAAIKAKVGAIEAKRQEILAQIAAARAAAEAAAAGAEVAAAAGEEEEEEGSGSESGSD